MEFTSVVCIEFAQTRFPLRVFSTDFRIDSYTENREINTNVTFE